MPTLTTTRNYEDGQTLTEAHLDAALDSIETFVNTTKLDTNNLQSSAVEAANIASSAVTAAKIASDAVTTVKILDSNITLAKLATAVANALVPAGTVLSYGAEIAPSGYLLCDGSAVSRTDYSALFAVIGESFGQGDNSTTFNVPDLRGRFIRGWDDGQSRDPDAASRTAMATGGNTGDNIGSIQEDDFESHSHTRGISIASNAAAGAVIGASDGVHSTTGSSGGNETRPKNAYLNFIIKA